MKKIKFFVLFVLISLLACVNNQVKADTIHIQMPAGIQNFCQADGLDTFVFHKPAAFGPTVWILGASIVASGDTYTFLSNNNRISLYFL